MSKLVPQITESFFCSKYSFVSIYTGNKYILISLDPDSKISLHIIPRPFYEEPTNRYF